MASCLPTGRPHCVRAVDHSRAIFRHHLALPAQSAGRLSRPVLRVASAILRPAPSLPMRFFLGTRTLWDLVKPFSRPLSPMKALRLSKVIHYATTYTTKQE